MPESTGNLAQEIMANLSEQTTQLSALNGQLKAFLPKLLSAVVVLVVGWALIRLALNLITQFLKRSKIDSILHAFILSVAKILMYVLLAISCVDALGLPTTTLITSLGAVGLAVSLAVKDSLTNLAGGIVVLLIKPFGLGDYIESDGVSGTVSEIGIVHTILKTVDNKKIYVPNGDLAKAKIINYSSEPLRRLDLVFSVGYGDDFEKAKRVIGRVVADSGMALEDPAPVIRVAEHGSNSIDIACRAWVKQEDYWELSFYLKEQVKLAFDREGISIPYNQLDLHIVKE